jgi:hypothetical protein
LGFLIPHFQHARVVHPAADQGLALKAFEEGGITLWLRMRNFDRKLAAGAQIRRAKDGGYPTPRHAGFEAVVIQAVSRLK